jgi:hypothetical protein
MRLSLPALRDCTHSMVHYHDNILLDVYCCPLYCPPTLTCTIHPGGTSGAASGIASARGGHVKAGAIGVGHHTLIARITAS